MLLGRVDLASHNPKAIEMYLALNREDAEKIITDPDIYRYVRDDSSPNKSDFELPEGFIPLVAYDPDPVGCTILHQRNGCTYEVHIQILPGSGSFKIGKAMLVWIWDNIAVDKLVGLVPADNRVTLHYGLRLGFKIEGISTNSIRKNKELLDQTYIGLERWQQQQQI